MLKKYLHTRLRVSDMEKSISFYQDILEMEVIEQKTSPRSSKLVFLKFPGMDCELELCSFPDSGSVHVPEDLVHLAFEVDALEACIKKLNVAGVPITEGPLESSNGTKFIFTEESDKYEIELMYCKG
jgi:lactoylglutathione lyase